MIINKMNNGNIIYMGVGNKVISLKRLSLNVFSFKVLITFFFIWTFPNRIQWSIFRVRSTTNYITIRILQITIFLTNMVNIFIKLMFLGFTKIVHYINTCRKPFLLNNFLMDLVIKTNDKRHSSMKSNKINKYFIILKNIVQEKWISFILFKCMKYITSLLLLKCFKNNTHSTSMLI